MMSFPECRSSQYGRSDQRSVRFSVHLMALTNSDWIHVMRFRVWLNENLQDPEEGRAMPHLFVFTPIQFVSGGQQCSLTRHSCREVEGQMWLFLNQEGWVLLKGQFFFFSLQLSFCSVIFLLPGTETPQNGEVSDERRIWNKSISSEKKYNQGQLYLVHLHCTLQF